MEDGASTLMSIRDAAQATGLSPKALRRRIERGTLTSVMIGGRRRIPMEALARRGLIASGHDPVTGHRLVDGAGPVVDAIVDRLHRLEVRVAALEAMLGQPGDGGPVAVTASRRVDGRPLGRRISVATSVDGTLVVGAPLDGDTATQPGAVISAIASPDGAGVTADGAGVTVDGATASPDGAGPTVDGAGVTVDGAAATADGAGRTARAGSGDGSA